jgi:hypothetical protein
MKQHIHKLDTGVAELLLVKVPADLVDYYLNDFGITGKSEMHGQGASKYIANIQIDNINEYEIVGILANLDSSHIGELVQKDQEFETDDINPVAGAIFKNYKDDRVLITADQSLYSCFTENGILTKEPVHPYCSSVEMTQPGNEHLAQELQQRHNEMEMYFNPKTTLILKKKI